MNSKLMPKRKLADVLAELDPLPPGETLPDVDEGLPTLDGDPLDASSAARPIDIAQNLGRAAE